MGEVVKALHTVTDIGLQDASLDIWDRKYRLQDRNGVAVDRDIANSRCG